jgi:ABC-2 type transport system permease protein
MQAILAIFLKALWRSRVATLGFAAGMFAFEFITVVTYQSIGGTQNIQQIFEALGPDMQRLLKLAPNLQVGFGPANYLAFAYFHPVFLGIGSAYVVSRASDAIAGDIERGTILFVLSRAVSRTALLSGKTLALLAGLAVVVGGAVLGTAVGLLVAPPAGANVNLLGFVLVGLNAYVLFLALGGVALILSALFSSAASVAGWATTFALVAFVADFLAGLPVLNLLSFLSPFRYYDPQRVVATNFLPPDALLTLSIVALGGFILAAVIFERRDIAA